MERVFTLMRILLAYITIVLLWATTPLAIKWSGEGPGFLFGVTARMCIGTVCILIAMLLARQPLLLHRKALFTYLAVALQIYGAMLPVYWAAQFIPSGWLSVVSGLTPLMTALLTAIFLKGQRLTIGKLIAYSLGIAGLYVMFGSALQLGDHAVLGIIGVLASTLFHSISAVWIKRINTPIPALSKVAGGLLIALPAYLFTWGLVDGHLPTTLTQTTLASIIYLGVIATTLGFIFYYYLLANLAATRVALITLITPLLSLLLGDMINHETLDLKTLLGAVLIISALIIHEFFERLPSFKSKSKYKERR